MTRSRSPTQELEAALTVLDDSASDDEAVDGSESAPPPLPEGGRPVFDGDYQGRTEFDDLFQIQSVSGDPARMTPEEKVSYFRQKLKAAEEQIARFRGAWNTRNRELDHVESLLEEASNDREQANERLVQLERFLEDKRAELDRYAKSVADAFAEQEEKENELREKLADEQAEQERLRDEADIAERTSEEITRLRAELGPRVQTLEDENRSLTDRLEEASGEIALLRKRISDREDALGELREDAEETEARLRNAAANRDEELTAMLAEYRQRNEKLEAALAPLQGEVESWKSRAAAAEADAKSKNNQLVARDELVKHYREQAENVAAKSSGPPPPPPIDPVNPAAVQALAESIHYSGRTLSAVIRGEERPEANLDQLREVLRRLKVARSALDEIERD
ncbi:MAG: hypothetical protein AAFZ38_11390 [Myxococcota bacterium]